MIRALAVASCLAIGCGPKPAPGGVTPEQAVVYIQSNVRDAQLYVDGRLLAPLDTLGGGVAVEPGTHRFELRHDDYFSRYLELTVTRAERKKIALPMAAVLP